MTVDQTNPGSNGDDGSSTNRERSFESANANSERAAAFRAGRVPIPPKFFMAVIVAFVVLGLGGTVLEHFVGSNQAPNTSPNASAPLRQIDAPLASFMGLRRISQLPAPTFTLRDQFNHAWSLAEHRGKVIVLTFYDKSCNDICTVLGAELRQGTTLLGANASKVDLVIVNTDPHDVTVTPAPRALVTPGLGGLTNTYFLTGSLQALDSVWVSYGISINVGAFSNQIAHNDLIYFISPTGDLTSSAIPFGNENHAGAYSLNTHDVHRFAQGIALTAGSLVKP